MGTRREERAPGRLKDLRRGIDRWRRTRVSRGPMPAQLWARATELARELGAYRVAREVGVGYQSLRDRLGDDAAAERRQSAGFVEIKPAALFAAPAERARGEVELSDASGVKLVIRRGAGESVDIAALLAAFRATAR